MKYRDIIINTHEKNNNNVCLTGIHMPCMPMSICNAEEKCNVSLALHYVSFEVGMKYNHFVMLQKCLSCDSAHECHRDVGSTIPLNYPYLWVVNK